MLSIEKMHDDFTKISTGQINIYFVRNEAIVSHANKPSAQKVSHFSAYKLSLIISTFRNQCVSFRPRVEYLGVPLLL